jgi:hypothetical protein
MPDRIHSSSLRRIGMLPVGFVLACAIHADAFPSEVNAQTPTTVLHTAAALRGLTVEQAQQQVRVHLRGVVTFFDENLYSRFIQDGTAGIYLQASTNTPQLFPGQVVDVNGVSSPGEYAPIVVPERVRIVGTASLP